MPRLDPVVLREPPHLDQLEPQRAHAVEHSVEGGLVDELAVQDGLDRLHFGVQTFEHLRKLGADAAPNVDLVACRHMLPAVDVCEGPLDGSEESSPPPGERGRITLSVR
jgi:hypothetical protein